MIDQSRTEPEANTAPTRKVVGLGYFAGSLHEMSYEEHIAKLRALECEVPCEPPTTRNAG